ncbi:MAG TPA: type II toxin-antitoxin system RatA family toxin, partial [Xylella taiwanensis]
MPIICRSALVCHSASCMFDLVNDIAAYPCRFSWCHAAQLFEHNEYRLMARLDVGLGALRTWFTTENTLQRPSQIDMKLCDGPFKRLEGRWEFQALAKESCKVSLRLEFEPVSRVLSPALTLGFHSLADRMVND